MDTKRSVPFLVLRYLVASGPFGLVEPAVGLVYQFNLALAAFMARYAYAYCDSVILKPYVHFLDSAPDALRRFYSLVEWSLGKHYQKFLSSIAADSIYMPQARCHDPAYALKHPVALQMAVLAVYPPEMVNINH